MEDDNPTHGWTIDDIKDEDLPPDCHHEQTDEDPPDLPPLESE